MAVSSHFLQAIRKGDKGLIPENRVFSESDDSEGFELFSFNADCPNAKWNIACHAPPLLWSLAVAPSLGNWAPV